MERGVIKGEPSSPPIFNIMVHAVVRAVLLELCGYQDAHHGFVWAAGEKKIVLNAEDIQIARHNHIYVQTTLTAMVSMFDRVGIHTNLVKTKAILYTPGFIWGQHGSAVYKKRSTVEGSTFRKRKITRVSCTECGRKIGASSLCHRMERSNWIVLPQNI